MSAIRLHHIVQSLEPGGLENGVVNLVNRLDRERFASTIWCLKRRGAFAERIDPEAAQIFELGWTGGNDPTIVWKLARALNAHGAELVHTRNAESFFYGWAALQLNRRPVLVHSEHGRTFDDRPARFVAQRWMSRRARALVAVSDRLRLDLERHVGIGRDAIEVVYNGVDFDRFANSDRHATRASLGWRDDDFVIGSVGRLVSVKNYELLLRAAAKLSDTRWRVALIGDGPERATLEQRAAELGIGERVFFAGHRDDVPALMSALDAFVLPSKSEGMSNTLLEAMAAGLPVVASDVGGNAEIVRDGQDGIIFPSGDEAALALALDRLIATPELRRSFAKSGRDRAQRDFSMAAMVRAYEALYQRAMARTGHPLASRPPAPSTRAG